ncbi:YlxR family protein [Bacillaceae bacterium]
MRQRKIPLRKCVACQEMVPKKELIRIVRTPEGDVKIDPTGKASGRGAYICAKRECFQAAKKRKALDRSLKVTVSEQIYDELEKEWLEAENRGK